MPAGAGHSFGRQGTDGGSCAHRGRKRPHGHSGTRRRDRAARPRQVLPFGRDGHSGSPRRRRLDRPSRDGGVPRAERSRQVDDDRHAARTGPARRRHCLGVRPGAVRSDPGRSGRGDAPDRLAAPRPHRPGAGGDDGGTLPSTAGRRRGARGHGDRRDRRPVHAEAVRRADPACPLRPGARPRPGAPRPRRAHRGHGRRGPPHVLDDDARLRGAGQDGPVRDALPGGGRCLRRPDRAHGARIDRRGRPAHRDQGDGRLPHDPGDAAPCLAGGARAAAGRDAGGAPRRVGHPGVLRLGSRNQGAARALPGRARPRDHGRRARGGIPAAHRRRAEAA